MGWGSGEMRLTETRQVCSTECHEHMKSASIPQQKCQWHRNLLFDEKSKFLFPFSLLLFSVLSNDLSWKLTLLIPPAKLMANP